MIGFYSPLNFLGYGVHSYSLIKAYEKLGNDVALIPPFARVDRLDDFTKRWLRAGVDFDPKKHIGLMIFHEEYLKQFSGRVRVGFPVFEMVLFNQFQLSAMDSCDLILQPSEWGKQVLKANGIKEEKVKVVPEGYDPDVYFPDRTNAQGTGLMNFRINFVHVGKYEERKSTKEIVEAFTMATDGEKKKTLLFLHCLNPFLNGWQEEVFRMIRDKGWKDEGELISLYGVKGRRFSKQNAILDVPLDKFATENDMARVYNFFHFGIWASKAEGWNLPLIECSACGVPSFTMTQTGQSEFTKGWPEEFVFDKFDWMEANDGRWFRGDRGNWACPQVERMAEKIKAVLADPERSYLEGRKKVLEAMVGFTWENSALKLQEVLKGL